MVQSSGLTTMGTESEGVESSEFSQVVESSNVGVEVVVPVAVWWVFSVSPVVRCCVVINRGLEWFITAFVINGIESAGLEEESVQFGVLGRIKSDVNEWLEDILEHFTEVVDHASVLVCGVQSWDLDEPSVVI
jgi:hypothetical protein